MPLDAPFSGPTIRNARLYMADGEGQALEFVGNAGEEPLFSLRTLFHPHGANMNSAKRGSGAESEIEGSAATSLVEMSMRTCLS